SRESMGALHCALGPVGERAVLWNELLQSRKMGRQEVSVFLGRLLPNYLVFPILSLLCYYFALFGLILGGALRPAEVNSHVRVVGTAIAGASLVIVALSAAGRVSREREQRTLDSLLTTPLGRGEILFEKWLASICSLRPIWWAAAPIWILGLIGGGLH